LGRGLKFLGQRLESFLRTATPSVADPLGQGFG
jgi:hypothetical protein